MREHQSSAKVTYVRYTSADNGVVKNLKKIIN